MIDKHTYAFLHSLKFHLMLLANAFIQSAFSQYIFISLKRHDLWIPNTTHHKKCYKNIILTVMNLYKCHATNSDENNFNLNNFIPYHLFYFHPSTSESHSGHGRFTEVSLRPPNAPERPSPWSSDTHWSIQMG